MTQVNDGENQTLISKSYSECQDLAIRLARSYVGAARTKNKSEILKIIQDGVSFAFADLPNQLSFLEAALLPFVSKLASADIPDMYVIGLHAFLCFACFKTLILSYLFACSLADVEKRTRDANMNEDQSVWRPYFTFVEHLREKHAKNEVLQGVLNSLFCFLTVLVSSPIYCG